jgi:hypothetical protein
MANPDPRRELIVFGSLATRSRSFALDRTSGGSSSCLDGYDCSTTERGQGGVMTDEHIHNPEPESSSLAGYAAIKYTAIVIIVLAILAFLAWYVIPAFNN